MPSQSKEDKGERKPTVDYKARVEKKLCLARETPEPVFDVSDCNLKDIPSNIFSLCKVFRKEALYLQNNLLSSLSKGGPLQDLQNLRVLDISANKFTKLPSNINELERLEVLNVSKNQLTELPQTIGDLHNLVLLNASYNKLMSLPSSLGNCNKLEVLKVTYNEPLRELPAALGRIGTLLIIEIDKNICYPPQEVCNKGLEEILGFFRKELHEDLERPSTSVKPQKQIFKQDYNNLQEHLKLHEKLKSDKQKAHVQFEKQLLDSNKKEAELQQQLRIQKNKLLEEVMTQRQSLDAELAKFQEKKNVDRAFLIKLLKDDEENSNEVVQKILNSNKNLRNQIISKWDSEQKEEEKKLLTYTKARVVESKQILASMGETMKEEIEKAQNCSSDRRTKIAQSLASELSEQDAVFQKLIKKYDENQLHLIETLTLNEEIQKSAVASLLEKSDSVTWELKKQIAIVERELAELTRLELSRKKLETDCQISELNKNRIALTQVLVTLLEQQAERRKHLVDTISKMEMMREAVAESDAFWMQQYDKLLNSKSHEMVKFLESVHPTLVKELFMNGVFHYLPLLKDVNLSETELKKLNANNLSKLGVKSPGDREKILQAVESFLNQQRRQPKVPSAPSSEEPTAPVLDNLDIIKSKSASYLVPEECVICLEIKPNIIFVPCGHICCCYKCFKSISLCPLCRSQISEGFETEPRKIKSDTVRSNV